jgi:hypothetical protein
MPERRLMRQSCRAIARQIFTRCNNEEALFFGQELPDEGTRAFHEKLGKRIQRPIFQSDIPHGLRSRQLYGEHFEGQVLTTEADR